jgi:Protein of unknown function (DUF2975)
MGMCRAKNAKEKSFSLRFSSRFSRDNLLIGFYISFFDKKDLNNGIDWLILRAMNANEISPKANPRMTRIQKVSKCIRLLLLYGIPLYCVVFFIWILCVPKNWINAQLNSPDTNAMINAMTSTSYHIWEISSLVLWLFWYRTVLKLFGFFEKGFLFTAETVRYIQMLGGIYVAGFFVRLCFYFLIPEVLRDTMLTISTGDLLAGLFIIFIGWLIDEARKIREEQELTV